MKDSASRMVSGTGVKVAREHLYGSDRSVRQLAEHQGEHLQLGGDNLHFGCGRCRSQVPQSWVGKEFKVLRRLRRAGLEVCSIWLKGASKLTSCISKGGGCRTSRRVILSP